MKDFTYRMPMTVYFSEDTNVIEKIWQLPEIIFC